MQVWVYNSDEVGIIGIFATKEKAMETFRDFVERTCSTTKEKEEAISQMEECGYYYEKEIFPMELIK